VVFATYSCSLGTGIYALCLSRNLSDFKGLFFWTGDRKRAGVYEARDTFTMGAGLPPHGKIIEENAFKGADR
jgi:hypothetical protein